MAAANGRLEATDAVAYIAGPALAGVVSGSLGPTATVAINAGSFGTSLLGLAAIRLRPTERPPDGGPASGPTRAHDLRTGAAFLRRTPVLRALAVLLTITTFLSLGMTDVFIHHLRHGLGQDEHLTVVLPPVHAARFFEAQEQGASDARLQEIAAEALKEVCFQDGGRRAGSPEEVRFTDVEHLELDL
ncbi:MFS transporter [Streptomyces sp. TG1A-8]|uniref:MFS transporter n=1 Tax=Streptomyces sp. TG1A-8 TaxID=3051385 RepID=UPI003463AB54